MASWTGIDLRKFTPQQSKDLLFTRFHPRRLCGTATLMVIAEEMEDAVQQEKIEFAGQRETGFRCITGRSLGRDHYITEKVPFSADHLPFLLSKGDDIGRLVTLQIVAVNLADTPVTDDENRQFGVRTSRDA